MTSIPLQLAEDAATAGIEIDGALVGGASLDPEDLALIIKYR